MNVYHGRLLKQSSNQKSKLIGSASSWHCWSLDDFQTSHFICYLFGWKLWFWSIQNYAWNCFQAFALRHLKWLCCSMESEVTPFPLIGRWYRPAALDLIRNMWFCSYVIFLLRDEWMIERFSKAVSAALVSNNLFPILWKFHFPWKKKVTCCFPKFTKH